MQHFAFIVVSY